MMIVFLPLFAAIQAVHWAALLLDEVLFPAYRKVRPTGAVFVVGVPRSGTTFLHRVLAQDTERFTTFTLWELLFAPAICERRVLLGAARIDRLLGRPAHRLISWVSGHLMKKVAAVHRISLQDAEEDFLVLSPILACFLLIVPFPFAPEIQDLSRFDERFSEAERRHVMSFYYAMVQRHLHVHGSQRVFLSKNVSFTPMLQGLLKTFPRARIVACSRPPEEAVPSQISAMEGSWRLFGNGFTPELFENRWLDLMEDYYAHLADVLAQIPGSQRASFEMDELRTDLVECVQRLYDRFAFIPSEGYAGIVSEEAQAARSYHSRHRYTLHQYGLNENFIRRRYATVYATLNTFRGE
jgi:hypothetical protein